MPGGSISITLLGFKGLKILKKWQMTTKRDLTPISTGVRFPLEESIAVGSLY